MLSFFAKCGFQSVSVLGWHFYAMRNDEAALAQLAELVKKYDLILTMHHELPRNHSDESAPGFKFKCQYPESDEKIIKTYNYWKEVSLK